MQRLWRSKLKLTSSEHPSSESENLPVELAYLLKKKEERKNGISKLASLFKMETDQLCPLGSVLKLGI